MFPKKSAIDADNTSVADAMRIFLPWIEIAGYLPCKEIFFSLALGDHPKPAIDDHLKTGQRETSRQGRYVAPRQVSLRRHEQRIERREATTSNRFRATGLVLAANPEGHRYSPRNGRRLSEGRRDRVRPPGGWGRAAKPANEVTTDSAAANRARVGTSDPNLQNRPMR